MQHLPENKLNLKERKHIIPTRQKMIPLKCDFHLHYIELMSDNPESLIDTYYKLNYDCIALTEHDVYMDYKLQQRLIRYANNKYGNKLIVIFGEEMNFFPDSNRGFNGGDILGLFIHSKIDHEKHNQPERILEAIHEQGGLAISAHDARTNLKTKTGGLWGIRQELALDGFEVVNASSVRKGGDAAGLTHPEEAIAENYICLANSDTHSTSQLENNKHIHTIVYVRERSIEAVREALELRQTVAVYGDRCFGTREWVQRYQQIINKEK